MRLIFSRPMLLVAAALLVPSARAGQAPGAASEPDVPVSHRDRVYAAEQFSNTVSVTDPVDNKLLGVREGGVRLCHRRWPQRSPGVPYRRLLQGRHHSRRQAPPRSWPSGDGTRVYVGLENDDGLAAIDTLTNEVIATVPIGQAAQAVNYVPNAVPKGDGTQGLQPLGVAGEVAHLTLVRPSDSKATTAKKAPSSVSLFDQGLLQVLQASVTGLDPKQPYVLALSHAPDARGELESLATFTTNPAGSAIVNALGSIRQVVRGEVDVQRRYLVIAPGTSTGHGAPVQIQAKESVTP